ncbi:MAG: 3-deoxy-D-manno-octulosonic acid transferase [Leptospirales bacterium]
MDAKYLYRITRTANRLLWPFILPILGGIWSFSQSARPFFRERLGLRSKGETGTVSPPTLGGPKILFHLASLGEAHAATPLIESLSQHQPLYLTTTTITGRAALQKKFPGIPVSLAPLDLPDLWDPFLKSRNISGILLFETEIWPSMMLCANAMGIPIGMVNGRLSSRGLKRMRRFRFIFRPLIGLLDPVLVQSSTDMDRFLSLGAQPEKVILTGNLKWDSTKQSVHPDQLDDLEGWLGEGEKQFLNSDKNPFRLLLSSMHPKETELLLKAILAYPEYSRPLHLVLAPRHLDRIEEFQESFLLFPSSQTRSGSRKQSMEPSAKIFLSILDTYGELPMMSSLCQMAVIGGTLEPIGGHSPIEAAQEGIPIVIGPFIDHIRDLVQTLEEGKGVLRVKNSESIPPILERLMKSGEEAEWIGTNARDVCERQKGAQQRTLAGLEYFLWKAGGSRKRMSP